MAKKGKQWENAGKSRIEDLLEILRGGVLAGGTSVMLLLMCSVLMSFGVLRERWLEGTVLTACVLGGLTGGGYVSLRLGRGTLVLGLAVGIVLSLMLLTAGVLVYHADLAGGGGFRVMAACLCGGGIAGILFGKPKKKRRR